MKSVLSVHCKQSNHGLIILYIYIFESWKGGEGGNSEKMDFVNLLNRSKDEKDHGPVKRNGKGGGVKLLGHYLS